MRCKTEDREGRFRGRFERSPQTEVEKRKLAKRDGVTWKREEGILTNVDEYRLLG